MDLAQLIKYFISIMVVCNPFSAIPALLNFTRGRSIEEKKRTAFVASLAVAIILVSVTWVGGPLLYFFDISIPAFQIAGGFVLFLLSLSMLNAEISRMKQTSEDQKEARERESIAVVPLAIPIIAGPGAISTAVVESTNFPGWQNKLGMSLCGLVAAIALGTLLHYASKLEKLLGHSGMNILGRIGGLILAAIAVETISKGVLGLFPGLR